METIQAVKHRRVNWKMMGQLGREIEVEPDEKG